MATEMNDTERKMSIPLGFTPRKQFFLIILHCVVLGGGRVIKNKPLHTLEKQTLNRRVSCHPEIHICTLSVFN